LQDVELTLNLQRVHEKIALAAKQSGRAAEEVQLLAVSKTFSAADIRALYQCGQRSFAENYVQEFKAKQAELAGLDIQWHFIGHLQTNKIKQLEGNISLIHSVDSLRLAKKMADTFSNDQPILIEVNLAGETSKAGCSPEELPPLVDYVQSTPRLKLRGLMFMPPADLAEAAQLNFFSEARNLRDSLVARISSPHNLKELSMGTSHDFVAAIREGATIVRLGTALFGSRVKE
jgi:pyridoxal phosphate enzyme (YggS family)